MSSTAFFSSLIIVWMVLYIAAPTWMIIRGWLLSGGFVQLVGALLPGIWQTMFWPNEAGNFGLLMMMLVSIPLCIIMIGSIVNLVRVIRWLLQRDSGKRGIELDELSSGG